MAALRRSAPLLTDTQLGVFTGTSSSARLCHALLAPILEQRMAEASLEGNMEYDD